jgi:hypothetical protein
MNVTKAILILTHLVMFCFTMIKTVKLALATANALN